MNSEKYIGLDVHRATISVAVMDSGGKLVMESILETVDGPDGHAFIYGSMDKHEFRFVQILDWIRQHIKPLV